MATKAEKLHMGRIAEMPCAVCGVYGVHVHHIRTGVGMGRRASNLDTIPLCPEHHQGMTGIHGMGRKAFERNYGVSELELLSETKRILGVENV